MLKKIKFWLKDYKKVIECEVTNCFYTESGKETLSNTTLFDVNELFIYNDDWEEEYDTKQLIFKHLKDTICKDSKKALLDLRKSKMISIKNGNLYTGKYIIMVDSYIKKLISIKATYEEYLKYYNK